MLNADADANKPGAVSNHPLAIRMGIIAFLTNNITIGILWGSFSVLLVAVEAHLSIERKLSTLAIPAMNLAMAAFAPFVGMLASRFTLRLIMLLGTALLTAGFVLLAVSNSFPLYLVSYGLLLGPGMAIGVILPATLVTRWFTVHRGRALGLVCTPVVIALVPLSISWVLQSYGLATSYWVLASIAAIALLANFFIIDAPPDEQPVATATDPSPSAGKTEEGLISIGKLLSSYRFWAIAIAGVTSNTSSIILTAHMVPMAGTWGFSPTLAATLMSIQSLIGIAGTILFGWVADKIGGVKALMLVVLNGAILWSLLLLHPPFILLAILIGFIGLHGAGVLPVVGLVLSQLFGRENFSRVYGISNLFNLPFSVAAVPAAAIVYSSTGSYSGAIIGQVAFFLVGFALTAGVRAPKAATNT